MKDSSSTNSKRRPILMTHIVAGYPSMAQSEKIGKAMLDGGADILEVQIPFSDPMADGPSITVACEKSLATNTTVASSLKLIKSLASGNKPIVVMTYLNIIFKKGISFFIESLARSNVKGIIVPDCPFDSPEGKQLLTACKKYNVAYIPVISPGLHTDRLRQISQHADWFTYCTSRQGITGANSFFSGDLPQFIAEVRKHFSTPIAIGFGIKTAKDVANIGKIADIAVVGSAFLNLIDSNKSLTEIREFTRLLSR